MKAIGNFLKKAIGWVSIFQGALMVLVGVMLVPPCLLGKLEGTYPENLMMAISFALMGASGVYLFRLGRKLCAGKKEPPITQKPAPAAEKPAEDKKTVPVEKPPETKKADPVKTPAAPPKAPPAEKPAEAKKTAPVEKPAEDGTIRLKTHWGGAREHGEAQVTLRREEKQWKVHCSATEYDEACNPTTREKDLTLESDYFETHNAQAAAELFASGCGCMISDFDQGKLCEKIPGLKPAHAVFDRESWQLDQALESGNAGIGKQERHWDSEGNICYTMKGTPRVKYYWFEDGTLVFMGKGATRSVDPGGYDGRHTYMPESPPWSDTVCQGTRRAVFTEGVTDVGSGLLQSLKNLEILDLADSVKSVEHNSIKSLRILRAGKQFTSFSGMTGPLQELKLPRGPVHFQYHNSGKLPGVTGATKEIQEELDRHLRLEFEKTMEQLFRACPEVGKKLSSMAALDKTFAAATVSSLDWNSKYKTNRYVPEEDLWKFHGLPKNVKKGMDMATIHMKWEYGYHSFFYLASMAHAAMKAKPSRLVCYVDSLGVEFAALTAWWRREFPGIDLTVNRECGECVIVKNTPKSDSLPTWQEMQAAKKTLSKEESERMAERFYQYSQDVGRGGTDPEIAAANRGLLFIEGKPVDPELLEIAKRLRAETNPDPYRRASRPYEVAGRGRQSRMHEESRFLLFLSKANLAETLGWGQSEYFAVDTRSMTPYYILEQYDGAVVAQSWYEIKEPVTWEELERLAEPEQKTLLGHDGSRPWDSWMSVRSENTGSRLALRWRRRGGGIWESVLTLTEEGYTLEYPGIDGKAKTLTLTREELKNEEILREKTNLPDHICKTLSKDGRYLRLPKK